SPLNCSNRFRPIAVLRQKCNKCRYREMTVNNIWLNFPNNFTNKSAYRKRLRKTQISFKIHKMIPDTRDIYVLSVFFTDHMNSNLLILEMKDKTTHKLPKGKRRRNYKQNTFKSGPHLSSGTPS